MPSWFRRLGGAAPDAAGKGTEAAQGAVPAIDQLANRPAAGAPERWTFPNMGGKTSLSARAPWRLPSHSSVSAIAADMARVEDLEIGAVSIVGPGHRCEEPATPRQDAYRLSRDTACRHLVVAIADGMSDSDQSHLGAAVAVGALATALRTELDRGTELAALNAPQLFLDAARQMAGLAAQRNLSEDAVRAAALAAVIQVEAGVDGLRWVWIASVGDASAWRRLPDGWERLIGRDKAGYDESALSEFLPFHPDRAVSRALGLQRGAVLALTTDGIGDVLQAGSGGAAWFAERWERPRHIADMLLDVGYEAKSHIDDRTAVVVWSDVGADP